MLKEAQSPSFTSKFGLIASGAAAAVGLGNIWRFPSEVAKYGGGGYLLLYVSFTLLLGFPLVLLELEVGRHKGKGIFGVFQKGWTFMGWLISITCWVILTFYNVVTGWVLGYAWKLMRGTLMASHDFHQFYSEFKGNIGFNLGFTLLVGLLLIVVNSVSLEKGIERICKVAMPLLLFLILGLVVFSCTLDCAGEGIRFYLTPRWDSFSPSALGSALSQSFLSLGIGAGILITYGSYTRKEENLVFSSLVIVLSDLVIAFFAGFFLFPLLFCEGVDPQAQGPSLTFIYLPLIFQKMTPFWGMVVGFFFFVLLFLAAITSAMSVAEVPSQYLQNRFKWSRRKSIFWLVATSYVVSGAIILNQSSGSWALWEGFDLMGLLSLLSIELAEPFSTLLFCLFLARHRKKENRMLWRGVQSRFPKWLQYYLDSIIMYIGPFVVVVTIFLNIWIRFSSL